MTIGNSLAFPSTHEAIEDGLTKREYFAIHCLAATMRMAPLFANKEKAAKFAVEHADALIEELNREPKQKTAETV